MNKQVFIVVRGRVQGVFFRAETKRKADELGIMGWVKNTGDDGVEILAVGDEANLQEFLAWCKKGPPHAKVAKVEIAWQEPVQQFSGFSIE